MMDHQEQTQTAPQLAQALVLGMRCDSVEFDDTVGLVDAWAARAEPDVSPARVVCAANVHMVMEAWDDSAYQAAVNHADLVYPTASRWSGRFGCSVSHSSAG